MKRTLQAVFNLRCVLPIACAVQAAIASGADFSDLLRRVPGEANAILLIDAEALFASPIAERDGWKERRKAGFAERPLSVPVEATKVVRASQIDLQTREPAWEVALIEAPKIPSIDSIAKKERGYVDQVASKSAAWSPRGVYVIALSDHAVGLAFPPNRQFLARWIKEPSGRISPYLLKASQSMLTTDAQLLIALHVEDAVDPAQTRKWIEEQEFAKKSGASAQQIAEALGGLRGIKFEVVLKEKAWGRLQLDFAADPEPLVPIANQLVVAALQRMGAALDEIEGWKVSREGETISLHGPLTDGGLMRLGSLFELPTLDDESEESPGVDKPTLYATQSHFKSVTKLLDDLIEKKRDHQTMGQLASWIGQYAKRIDRLPLVNVDKDMADYSAGVAEDLREMSTTLKGAGIRAGVRKSNTYNTSNDYGGGNYDGYYGNRALASERRAIKAQEQGQSTLSGIEIADRIRSETSRIRRQMTERYKAEF
jgi:hypothetical protein